MATVGGGIVDGTNGSLEIILTKAIRDTSQDGVPSKLYEYTSLMSPQLKIPRMYLHFLMTCFLCITCIAHFRKESAEQLVDMIPGYMGDKSKRKKLVKQAGIIQLICGLSLQIPYSICQYIGGW